MSPCLPRPAQSGRRPTLSVPRRYYPGFFAALFIILMRLAIGWHFFYEGTTKFQGEGGKPFSAEGYFRAAGGPLARYYRDLVPDVDAEGRLDQARLERSWREDLDRISGHYGFTEEQKAKAEASLEGTEAKAEAWFRDAETIEKIKKYRDDLARARELERQPPSLSFERERAEEARKKLESERRELVATVDGWSQTLHDSWMKLVDKGQADRTGPMPASWSRLDWINLATKVGLTALGACLMLGLFTRPAALGAALFLLSVYLSMPPWPGVPEPAKVEGHYLFVNKNLVEMLACLVLASTPNGLWIGLDALLFGWRARRREARRLARQEGEPVAVR